MQTMLFDLKPVRLAFVITDENGEIIASIPGALEMLAPYPGLRSFIGEWSREWQGWPEESGLLHRQMPGEGKLGGLLLEAVPIVPSGLEGCDSPLQPPRKVLICVRLPEKRSARFASFREAFQLTTAECRVAAEAEQGRTPSEIAARLGLSVHTVRSHFKRIFLKVGVHSQAGLVRALLKSCGGGPREYH